MLQSGMIPRKVQGCKVEQLIMVCMHALRLCLPVFFLGILPSGGGGGGGGGQN